MSRTYNGCCEKSVSHKTNLCIFSPINNCHFSDIILYRNVKCEFCNVSKFTDSSGHCYKCCENHMLVLGLISPTTARENVTYINEKCVECTVQVFECVYAERCIQRHFLQLCNWHYRREFKGFCPTHKAQLRVVTL